MADISAPHSGAGEGKALRADAQRNRARILEAAIRAFAEEGLTVPVNVIARRAGVGTGTVSRHFPTKEALYEAIVLSRVDEIVRHGCHLVESKKPGEAFFDFFAFMVQQGAENRGLAEALSGAGFDIEAAADGTGLGLTGLERDLLIRAQQAGAVRDDIDIADVKALLVGCLARERESADPAARKRMIDLSCGALRVGTASGRSTGT